MSFITTYNRLFQVEILHGYHLNDGAGAFENLSNTEKHERLLSYDIGKDMKIVPTPETQKILDGYKLQFRQSGSGFFVGVKLDQTALDGGVRKPLIGINGPLKLTFSVRLINPYFFNFSSLRLDGNQRNPYFFTNLSENVKGNNVFASRPVEEFVVNVDYRAGDLIFDPAPAPPRFLEALEDHSSAPIDLTKWQVVEVAPAYDNNAAYGVGAVVISGTEIYRANTDIPSPAGAFDLTKWDPTDPPHQYVTHLDRIPIYGPNILLDLAGAGTEATIKLTRLEDGSIEYTRLIESDTPFGKYHTQFEDVTPGRYEMEVKDSGGTVMTIEPKEFYLDGRLTREQLFGIVEIHHIPGSPNDEALLVQDSSQELKAEIPVFTICFKNRSTYWRYIFNQDQNPVMMGDLEANPTGDKRKFRTKTPLPLTKAFREVNRFNTSSLLPNPKVNLVKPDKTDFKIYSEIFVQI